MFHRILVAIDGSKSAMRALDKAIELQKLTDGELILLCVFKHHSLFEASLSMVRPKELEIPDKALMEWSKEVVEHAKQYAQGQGVTKVRGFVKGGRPSKVIVKFAKDKEADVIVVGTWGTHSEKDGMILGSVAHRVASNAKCPVLVV